jgi:hypothetical protein
MALPFTTMAEAAAQAVVVHTLVPVVPALRAKVMLAATERRQVANMGVEAAAARQQLAEPGPQLRAAMAALVQHHL